MGQFLTTKEVVRRTGVSRSTLYELMGKGEFPLPYRLTKRRVGWMESEVEAWIASRKATPIKVGAHRGRQVVRKPGQGSTT